MILQNLTNFISRNENYAEKFAPFATDKEPNKNEFKRIFDILCQLLMNPKFTEDVADCFPQLLPALVSASISTEKISFNDGDELHKLNSVILSKVLCRNKDLLVFVLHYFDANPAPFESIEVDYHPPPKRRNKRKTISVAQVSDYDLVTASYDILCNAPLLFKHMWNWSKFYKYLNNEDESTRWVAMNCIAIVLEMSESTYSSHAGNFLSKIEQYGTEYKEVNQNNIMSEDTKEIDELVDEPSVISIGGILLPIFKKSASKNKLNLVPVPSTRRNLQNLAFAVSSNKCVCLQGAVGSGKTALVEFLAQTMGYDSNNFAKVQLGDQTDSKMLLGMYRCTDIPGEFLWQPGVLTEAVLSGKWLLLEDIDCAATDVISVIGQLVETKTLSVPGYRDLIHVKSGFQLFVTRRFTFGGTQKIFQMPLQKHWSCVNVQSLSKDELVTIVQTLFPVLYTIASKMVDVYLLFSIGNDEDIVINSVRNARQISTRDLLKWCSRAVIDFDVSSPVSALNIFQDALDVFCCSVSISEQRLNLAVAVAHKLGIVKTKAEFFCKVHKPSVNHHKQCLIIGRANLRIKKSDRVTLDTTTSNFSYTRPSVCLLERIASCVVQKEPVLLVGETGTGKTSSVQYLAQITGHKLIVINMNQQSESTDLLGGYKPVDLKLLILPIREEFEILFRSYFAIEPNLKFLTHIGRCFEERKWKTLTTLMIHSTTAALKRINTSIKDKNDLELSKKWKNIAQKLEKLQSQVHSQYSLAFSFVEGSLVKALKNGDWVLLDEINLATAETLECLSGLLEGSCGSLSLLERGDKEQIKRHKDFAIFACMNPATDIGKKDLPIGLRNRFTEFFVDELTEKADLQLLVRSYLNDLNLPPEKIESIVKFYLNVRKEADANLLDGTGHKPHYSLRTLCRALSVSARNPCANGLRSLYEAFCLSFLTQLDSKSYPLVQRMIVKAILGEKAAASIIRTPIPRPLDDSVDGFICFEGYWIPKGDLEPHKPENYILTDTVKQNLKDLVRVVSIGKMPVLLQGDTSVGKTSLITYLAKASGHICVRINNHEHTDLQEYVGTYVADSRGKLVFKDGILVDAMRKGYWIILDELNLAPSDVLEALNRVLDDNRELFIPETQQVVKAHDNFMLFATQNPPGLYGGRKVLSRAFRNRFVELHFDEIPSKELQTILHKRCKMPETYCKQVISVMTELQVRRKSTATFAGKKGFITLRDLFRWAERYHLAPDTDGTLYDWSQHLADEGYLVLSSKVRHPEECLEIIQVLKKHLRRDVDPDVLFTLSEKTSSVTKPILEALMLKNVPGFEHVVWTFQMRKMAVLLSKACDFKEPVLLIGETGGGKTTVCQLLSAIRKQELSIVNCHMHTEASDFLGSLRPVREHKENQKLFEWVDGPLVKAMNIGGFFLVDEISLADDSVLERLNSLLEPERKLLIAEKPCTEENATISAHENFIFVGTMNPGGDYGKKELSPALRNRFTEIWCEGCVSFDDLKCIMVHNLRTEFKDGVSTAIIEFLKWLQTTEIGKKLVVSVRDILTWVNFVNSCDGLEVGDAFFHGAALSYIDGLGSGLTAAENSKKLKDFKDSALHFIKQQVQNTLHSKLILNYDEFEMENYYDKFGVHPFYVWKGCKPIPSDIGFAFASPTTRMNTLKVLRALQLKKPILLEGSPGVGKTSLVSALAKASRHDLLRLNLSDQTDISDLFGADLPVEGGKPGEFSWRDGPFLRALRNGDWILLDELNLASQSVLEGLNACLDHRGEVYIPELAMTFSVKPGTRLFGCQNPLRQGGARRGLPKSFLNRFTQVFVDALEQQDLKYILKIQFPELPVDLLDKMIHFNEELSSQVGTTWAHSGAPWEMNLRDVTRWCEITIVNFNQSGKKSFKSGIGAQLIYIDRMRTNEDKRRVIEIYNKIFSTNDHPLPEPEFPIYLTKEKVFLGDEMLQRSDSAVYEDDDLLFLREQKTVLRGLAQCVNMNWMAILIGGPGSGKSSLVHLLANLAGQKLKSVVVNSAMDTTEILGGFEQTDYDRHLEELLERVETLLIRVLRKKLKKENLDQVAHYHALLENVRHLSTESGTGKTMETTMSTETKLFLRKTEELSKLVSALKTLEVSCELELLEIEKKLTDLLITVEKDKCLNAGGKFEWVDSVLVKCLQNGTWLLLDQVNLCSPAILDRLNGLLEPNGSLTIGEKGVDQEGNVFTVKAHKNFRLFLTMDPRHGEISRAMRNRGVEISIPTPQQALPYNHLDVVSLLNSCGVTKLYHQEVILKIHENIYDKQYRLNELLQVASFTSQQISKGFPFEKSLSNSYRELCGTLDWRSRRDALRKVDDILTEMSKSEKKEFVYDLNAMTLRMSDLRKNSKLAMIKQEGFLLRSTIEKIRNDPLKIDFHGLLEQSPITDTMAFLKHVLHNFYERSSLDDLKIRRLWCSRICSKSELIELEKMNECFGNEVKSLESLFRNNSALDKPLSLIERSTLSNNLSIALYFRIIILKCQEDLEENRNVMYLQEYSSAVCSGKLSSNLRNEPLILKFVQLIEECAKIINIILHDDNLFINDKEYVELRDGLKWYQRFHDLGATELIDKSRGIFFDLREVSSSLKVHYKWLTKFFRKLFSLFDVESLNAETQEQLTQFTNKYMNMVPKVDRFGKIRKRVKKLLSIPAPHFSEDAMVFHEKLRTALKKLEITEEDLVDVSKTKLKVASVGLAENLAVRQKLIDICINDFKNNRENSNRVEDLVEIEEVAAKFVQVKDIDDKSKQIGDNFSELEIWPIYEFFFLLFTYRFQRKFCEEFLKDFNQDIYQKFDKHFATECSENLMDCEEYSHQLSEKYRKIYEENMFAKFETVPTIPVHLIGLIKALNSDETVLKRRISLFPELFFFVEEFSKRSFALNNSNILLHWYDVQEVENEENYNVPETICINKSALCNLIFELFLTKSGNKKEIINFKNHKNQKKLLHTIQALLWKNSLVLNSEEFNISANDCTILQFYINYYLSAINKMLNSFTLELNEKEQNDLKTHFIDPIKLLQQIKEKLDDENNAIERGNGWLILGYLKIFLFNDLGPIDPVRKIALKSKYIHENIVELEHLMCIENLQSVILGTSLPVQKKLSRINHLKECSTEAKTFENFQAARPSSSFQNLREEVQNFSQNVGSFELIFKQIKQLKQVADQVQKVEQQQLHREKLYEATIWKKSLERFSGKLEKNFLVGFPDLVSPIVSAVSNLHHGISILIQELSNMQFLDSDNNICYNLLRFPVVGLCQENYINIAKLCSSEQLISMLVKQSKSSSVQKNRFNMAKIALKELENLSLIARMDINLLWGELNNIFLKIRFLWKEQEERREEEAREKQSLFKTKSKSDEDDDSDFRKMFPGFQDDYLELAEILPDYQQSFPELQRIPEVNSSEKESFTELISTKDARMIQETHWNILRNYCLIHKCPWNLIPNTSRKTKNNIDSTNTISEPNLTEPLIQRFEMLGPSVRTWSENLSSQLVCSLNVLISKKSSFDNRKSEQEFYDFYTDPNIPEVEACHSLFDRLNEKINEFQKEWPDNPLLMSIKLIIERLFSFSINSSLARFLIGVELLLTKIQHWEENAHSTVSLAEFIAAFGEKVLRWRKLEISRWKDSLEVLEDGLKTEASKWWFFLFGLIDQYLIEDSDQAMECDQSGTIDTSLDKTDSASKEKIIESLERLLTESPLIEFEARLQLLYLFYQHISHLETTKKQKELSAIFWNIYFYYSQFLEDVQNKIQILKEPIAKKLKDTIKITRWNDISYWSVKNTAEKTRRTLHKFVKELQKGLLESVASHLTLKTKEQVQEATLVRELNPSDFLINLELRSIERIGKLTRKARQFCETIVVKSNYSEFRKIIEIFIEDSLEESKRLKNLEVDRTLTKSKQQTQLKSMLQQKKMALANYFKTLSRLGISYRIGILTWKNRKNEIIDRTSKPLNLQEIQSFQLKGNNTENVEKGLLEQWSDCNKYYYKSLVKLNFLDSILNSGKCNLEVQSAERCRGFSVHLVLLAHRQKETIADFYKHFLPFRIQIANLGLMMDEKMKRASNTTKADTSNALKIDVPRQKNLQSVINSFEELLEILQMSVRQIIIFLESCPMQSLVEEHLDLNESLVPVLKDPSVATHSISSLKDCLHTVKNIRNEFNSWLAMSKKVEMSGQIFLLHEKHVNFLQANYQKINEVKARLIDLKCTFTMNHPITENVSFLVSKIDENGELFRSTINSSGETSDNKEYFEEYETKLDQLMTQVLLVIQKKFQDNQKPSEKTTDQVKETVEEDIQENLITDNLIESLKNDVPNLKLKTVSRIFTELLQIVYECDVKTASKCTRSLLNYLPLLEQYSLFLHYYLYELVASFRLTCKFLYLQLDVFLDLATNGFCQPENADTEEADQEGRTAEGGMGLAEGEGQKDISDQIETEDQLEENRNMNEEEKEKEKKDMKEEEKGIEMSENFESHLQDMEQHEEEKNDEEDDDLDKEMGETNETAEKLDEEMWKDEEEEEEGDNENQDKKDEKEEIGSGETTGQDKLSAKDDDKNQTKDEDESKDPDGERKEEEKKEINEFEEPEVDDDQIDPYHGKQQPEIEPESFDMPEDVNLDDDVNEDNAEGEQEDPFDIDQMKETKLPEEKEEEEEESVEKENSEENKPQGSSDEEDDEGQEEDPNAESNKRKDEPVPNSDEENKDNPQEENTAEENEIEEEKAPTSLDAGSKEIDASEEVESKKDGSRDAVESQTNEEHMDVSTTENSTDDKKDKGTGQSQMEECDGHSGSKQDENAPTSGEEKSVKSVPKRRKPGEKDENRSLVHDNIQPAAKKLKTNELQQYEENDVEEKEKDAAGQSETYEHIKDTEKFDDYVFDAATEEQMKEQASNLEDEKENENENQVEDNDVTMHEDDIKEDEKEQITKEPSQKVPESKKEKSTNAKGERSDDIEPIDVGGEIDGDAIETTRVLRGNESTIHTKLETEVIDLTTEDIAQKRTEIENMLGQWSQQPSSTEAANAWSSISVLTESAARELSEKLRLVLEPTLTSRLKGDYRTGRRINMRKVIPYIASEFRKDKIWLRRTKPSKRDYQIILAIDDSSSMADNHSKELAFESLSLIGKAMTYLEVGQLAVINFGERVNILHPFGENFTEESGARLIQEMKFEQKKTMIGQLLDFTMEMFSTQHNSSDSAKLVIILSDGRGIFSEGIEKVTAAVRTAKLLNIFLVFVVVDNPLSKDSILDIRMPIFEGGKLLGIRSYMDNFPFPFYIILRDLDTLPIVLSDALRQWFEIVGRIDT